MRVTTTPSIEGWTIEEYLGPVVTHLVAGTGLFSDILAGFSDFFGGRSGSYQRQLASLSDDAVRTLRDQAADRGATWLVDLRLATGEVSGKNMQLLMLTATATAVRARPNPTAQSPAEGGTDGGPEPGARRIPAELVQVDLRRQQNIARVSRSDATLDNRLLHDLVQAPVLEALPLLLRAVVHGFAGFWQTDEQELERILPIVLRLPRDRVQGALYDALIVGGAGGVAALALIRKLELRDPIRILALLESAIVAHRRAAIQALSAVQRSYGSDDAAALSAIAERCADPATFPPVVTVVPSARGPFGTTERLRCECGEERPSDVTRCPRDTCGKDRLGFRAGEILPSEAARLTPQLAATVRRLLASETALTP